MPLDGNTEVFGLRTQRGLLRARAHDHESHVSPALSGKADGADESVDALARDEPADVEHREPLVRAVAPSASDLVEGSYVGRVRNEEDPVGGPAELDEAVLRLLTVADCRVRGARENL